MRGGPIFWLVFVLSLLPWPIYQVLMRAGNAPQLTPVWAGMFAGGSALVGWVLGRIADDAFKNRTPRRPRAAAPSALRSPHAASIYNPLTWEGRHRVALALAAVIGAACGVVLGYIVGAIGEGAGGASSFRLWLTYAGFGGRVPYSVWWGLFGALVAACIIYIGRLGADRR
jgi:hypothetical protein